MAEVPPVLKAALDYVKRYAWRLIPLRPRSKVPLIKDWVQEASDKADRLEEWFRQWPEAGIGVLLGNEAGTVVLDVDGPQGVELVSGMHLSDTLTATTSKGKHLFFQVTEGPINKKIRIFPEVDLLGEGCYVVVEPSIHPSGSPYRFDNLGHTLAPFPKNLLDMVRSSEPRQKNTQVQAVSPAGMILLGTRNITLASKAGRMRWAGMEYPEIREALFAINKTTCTPPLDEEEVDRIARSISRYETQHEGYHLTDDGNARRFVDLHGQGVIYCGGERRKWFIWDGVRFKEDDRGMIHYLARDVAGMIREEATMRGNPLMPSRVQGKLMKFALESENHVRLKAIVERAAVDPRITVTSEMLDRDPLLICVRNGYVNLRTNQLEKPDIKHLITKQARVSFNPQAECPRWIDFIKRVTLGQEDEANLLQELGGYFLTGETFEDKIFIFIGSGANGKSTYLETLGAILGDYHVVPPAGTFLERAFVNPSAASPELALLHGARLATLSETDQGDKVALGLLKRLSAGGKGSARTLYKGLEQVVPTAKIVIDSNHTPRIAATDHGTWRRICLVPFNYKFEGPDLIRDFRAKMVSNAYGEHDGIFQWMLVGVKRWLERGHLALPEKVVGAIQAYMQQEDPVDRFLNECTIRDQKSRVQARVLFNAFIAWCRRNGILASISQVRFAEELERRGYHKKRTKTGIIYLGLGLTSA